MSKIGIIGGAFDPIWDGHEQMASLASLHFDEVWLMPSCNHPHGKQMAPAIDRLNMAAIVARKYPKVRVSTFEMDNFMVGHSIWVMKKLTKDNMEVDFTWIMGQDCAENIDRWFQYEDLLFEFKFMVFKRCGVKAEKTWYHQAPHRFMDLEITQGSSTEVRAALPIQSASLPSIDKDVYKYIADHKLYNVFQPDIEWS